MPTRRDWEDSRLMRRYDLARRLVAEALGTGLLVAVIVGSGIMAARLANGDVALMLLVNSLATGAMLIVLILMFAPISGAHLNPAVSVAFALRGELSGRELACYASAQIIGGVVGVVVAHAMFALPLVAASTQSRTGLGQWLSEVVATFGLAGTILGVGAARPSAVPYAVGLYISAAYWFTASTSFANPAVTIARAFTDTFSGIRAANVTAFIAAQLIGAVVSVGCFSWLLRARAAPASADELRQEHDAEQVLQKVHDDRRREISPPNVDERVDGAQHGDADHAGAPFVAVAEPEEDR